eukprot:2076763-Pyramimonas_sp.AAC.1
MRSAWARPDPESDRALEMQAAKPCIVAKYLAPVALNIVHMIAYDPVCGLRSGRRVVTTTAKQGRG